MNFSLLYFFTIYCFVKQTIFISSKLYFENSIREKLRSITRKISSGAKFEGAKFEKLFVSSTKVNIFNFPIGVFPLELSQSAPYYTSRGMENVDSEGK